ncbi:MAG: UDP-N-acetylglucosamine 2-epimerase, partial [Candidatus Helarchaeota archaeon]
HPRTRKRLNTLDQALITNSQLHFLKPFGFSDYVHLQMHALCTISDSGTISEESAILSFPAISLRQSMERPEAQDAGTIILTGFDTNVVLRSVHIVIEEQKKRTFKSQVPFEYQIENTSWRVLKLIIGNAKLSNKWFGIDKK